MKKNSSHTYKIATVSLILGILFGSMFTNYISLNNKVFHYLDFVTWDSFYGLCEGVIESQDFDGNYIIITNHCSRKHVKGQTFRVGSKYLMLVY